LRDRAGAISMIKKGALVDKTKNQNSIVMPGLDPGTHR
jgi:hypothetical protein